MSLHQLETAFNPRSIAVVGASANPMAASYSFVHHLLTYGYKGEIYPINKNRPELLGLKTYPTLSDIPGAVDYAICCIPAQGVPDLLQECHRKGVEIIHLFTGRLTETGLAEAAELEKEILAQARKFGIRLIGPNCMGIYSPGAGISFGYDFPSEPGSLGMFFQSGGASTEFIHYASLRAIRFSKVVSYGNALDLDETDFLQYLSRDPETKVIASYMEGIKDGRKFLCALREAAATKPVIILKAGRGVAGARAVASHTASLAGSFRVWEAAIRQAGAILVHTLEEMIDLAVSFCRLLPVQGRRVGVVGGGGGKSVRSADEWEDAGFNVVPLPPEIRQEIRKKVPPMWWDWIENPVDASIMPESAWVSGLNGEILRMMSESPHFDLVIANITVDGPFGKNEMIAFIDREIKDILEINSRRTKPLAVVLNTGVLGSEDLDHWRWRYLAEKKTILTAAKVPVYPTIAQAANAFHHVETYHRRNRCPDAFRQIPEGLPKDTD
jgi:acetyltransferase